MKLRFIKVFLMFYQTIFTLTSEQLDKVRSESLMLVDDAMQNHVRESDLDKFAKKLTVKFNLDITSTMQQVIRYIVNQGIVVNDIANENEQKSYAKSDECCSTRNDLSRRNYCS